MSSISSKIESIDRLWFEPITAKVIATKKITMVDNTIVALGEDGKIYTTGVISRVCYSMHGNDGRIGRVLDGCIKLKVLSSNAVRQHKENIQKLHEARDKKWNKEQLLDYANKLGVELTPEQLEQMK